MASKDLDQEDIFTLFLLNMLVATVFFEPTSSFDLKVSACFVCLFRQFSVLQSEKFVHLSFSCFLLQPFLNLKYPVWLYWQIFSCYMLSAILFFFI